MLQFFLCVHLSAITLSTIGITASVIICTEKHKQKKLFGIVKVSQLNHTCNDMVNSNEIDEFLEIMFLPDEGSKLKEFFI